MTDDGALGAPDLSTPADRSDAAGAAGVAGVGQAPRPRVLVVCTGNSARSILAEALLRREAAGRFDVVSAGTEPKGVHPLTIRALAMLGVDGSGLRSKAVADVVDQSYDVVVTVCDRAREACPYVPGARARVHRSFDDPALIEGSDEERLAAFVRVRDEIARWAEEFAPSVAAGEIPPTTGSEASSTEAAGG